MKIDSIELCNFRNYEMASLEFHEHTNILYGDNAQGKTNVLESIFVCGTTKSHKGSKDNELIRIGQEEAHIRLFLTKKGISHKIDMHLKKLKGKGIAIDGVPIKKSGELLGMLNLIFFSPEDLRIVKNGPAERRKFLNLELSQLDGIYLHELGEYNKALMQRNKLLKQITFQPYLKDTIQVWDLQLVKYGKKIIERRKIFVEELNSLIGKVSEKLTGGREKISLLYEPNVEEDEFEKKLSETVDKDCRFCNTSVGPHRDDLCFINKDVDLRRYGSQGQQRTCALALKLAEIEIVKNKIGDSPILLLDDVLSELDRKRQNFLLDSIHDIQTVVTCTGLEEFIDGRFELDRVFRIVDGTVALEK